MSESRYEVPGLGRRVAANDRGPTSSADLVHEALDLIIAAQGGDNDVYGRRLATWGVRSKAHAEALERALDTWRMLGAIEDRPLSGALRARLAIETVVAGASDHPVRTAAARGLVGLAILTSALLAAGSGSSVLATRPSRWSEPSGGHPGALLAQHTTVRGEQRHLALPGGSELWLNWNTKVVVADIGEDTHVDVLLGDALFSVRGNDSDRLVVHAGGTRVRASPATLFNVHSHGPEDAFIQVKEGGVTITGRQGPPLALGPAQQSYFVEGKGTASSKANLASIAAWREGMVVFDNTPLVEVLYELTHYTSDPTRVGTIVDRGQTISATIPIERAQHALVQLADTYQLELVHPPAKETVVRSIDDRRL